METVMNRMLIFIFALCFCLVGCQSSEQETPSKESNGTLRDYARNPLDQAQQTQESAEERNQEMADLFEE
jgi:predicted component of type VI protein secretion system